MEFNVAWISFKCFRSRFGYWKIIESCTCIKIWMKENLSFDCEGSSDCDEGDCGLRVSKPVPRVKTVSIRS